MKSTKKDRKRKHKRQKEMCLPKQKSFRFSLKKKKRVHERKIEI